MIVWIIYPELRPFLLNAAFMLSTENKHVLQHMIICYLFCRTVGQTTPIQCNWLTKQIIQNCIVPCSSWHLCSKQKICKRMLQHDNIVTWLVNLSVRLHPYNVIDWLNTIYRAASFIVQRSICAPNRRLANAQYSKKSVGHITP